MLQDIIKIESEPNNIIHQKKLLFLHSVLALILEELRTQCETLTERICLFT